MRQSHRCVGLACGLLLLLVAAACDEDRCAGGSRPAIGTSPRIDSGHTPVGVVRDDVGSERDCVGVARTQVGTEHTPVGVKRGDIERPTNKKKPAVEPPEGDAPSDDDAPEA